MPPRRTKRSDGRYIVNVTVEQPDAIQCLDFVRRLAQVTGDGVATHLGVPPESFH